MKPQTALHQLQATPLPFLRCNYLSIHGAGTESGEVPYYFGKKNLPPGYNRNESYSFSRTIFLAGEEPYDIGAVQYVRMIPNNEALDFQRISGYDLNGQGSNFMLTSQLSGCLFFFVCSRPVRS